MYNDGKQLEGLVALVEELHLPPGFDIKTNQKVHNEEGVQVAEFDIEIRGRLGTTDIAWLIECRDRPGDGPAPGSWIEQLVGRRARFGFNKVTAVSTTGFAKGASDFAKLQGVEIREVTALAPEHFADWLVMQSITQFERSGGLHHASLIVGSDETKERREALLQAISAKSLDAPILRWIATDETVSAVTAFSAAVSDKPELYDQVVPNQPALLVNLRVRYPNDSSHFVVDTSLGAVRITEIVFKGELTAKQTEVPLLHTTEYSHAVSGESISQSGAFVFEALNTKLSLEMHKLTGSTGETQIVLRNLGKVK